MLWGESIGSFWGQILNSELRLFDFGWERLDRWERPDEIRSAVTEVNFMG